MPIYKRSSNSLLLYLRLVWFVACVVCVAGTAIATTGRAYAVEGAEAEDRLFEEVAAGEADCVRVLFRVTEFVAGVTLQTEEAENIAEWYEELTDDDPQAAKSTCRNNRHWLYNELAATDSARLAQLRAANASAWFFDPACPDDEMCQIALTYNPVLVSAPAMKGVVTARAFEAWEAMVNFIRHQMGLHPVPRHEVEGFKQSLVRDFQSLSSDWQNFFIFSEEAYYRGVTAWKSLSPQAREAWLSSFHREYGNGKNTDSITIQFLLTELLPPSKRGGYANSQFPQDQWNRWFEWSTVLTQLPFTSLGGGGF